MLGRLVAAWLRGDSEEIYPQLVQAMQHFEIEEVLSRLPEDLRDHAMVWLAENVSTLGERVRLWFDERASTIYKQAAQRIDKEDLHAVIASRGTSILARDLPYIIQACRWREYDRKRRERRELQLDTDESDLAPFDAAFEHIVEDDRLIHLRQQLSRLANVDVVILWRSAEGHDDATIATMLQMTPEAVRQRRHRAIRRLRRYVGNKPV